MTATVRDAERQALKRLAEAVGTKWTDRRWERHYPVLPPGEPLPETDEPAVACCSDCGLAYGCDGWIEAVVPRYLWHKISPTGGDGGLLCITCMARRAKRFGLTDVPVFLCGTEVLRHPTSDEAFQRGLRAGQGAPEDVTPHPVPSVTDPYDSRIRWERYENGAWVKWGPNPGNSMVTLQTVAADSWEAAWCNALWAAHRAQGGV